MITFDKKSILLFSPSFFGYENAVRSRLTELGAIVDYFDERPANTFWSKAFIRLFPKMLYYDINNYYNTIYDLIKDKKYDYILVINLEAMPQYFLNKVKKNNPNVKCILYMWDSISNKKNIVHYWRYFDSIFSFDQDDCRKFPLIKFRPLFFLNEYANINCVSKFEYDLIFIGTGHSDRFRIIQKIRRQAIKNGWSYYFYLYLQNWKLFLWNKLTNPVFLKAHLNDFCYVPLLKTELINLIKVSRIVIDIQHPQQNGLTIRTIEMLGAGKKLITTNAAIKNYDFYTPDNILVIDRVDFEIPVAFYEADYKPIGEEIYDKYSLDGWLSEIFHDLDNR